MFLNENGDHKIICLNMCPPSGRPLLVGLGGVNLFIKALSFWKTIVIPKIFLYLQLFDQDVSSHRVIHHLWFLQSSAYSSYFSM